jgi:glutathione S-transferase
MEYVEPERARHQSGLRLVLTTGVPGPWGEAAKALFHVKQIPFVPVRQTAAETNDALVEWTGFRNAPQAVYGDEPARIGWEEILALAERLEPTRSLVPEDERERALMMGMAHAICSEDGLGWNRRLQLIAPMLSMPEAATDPALAGSRRLGHEYGWSMEATRRANDRIVSILRLLADQLAEQEAAGRAYLIGDRLSALDLYWATFAAMLRPLPHALCPMPEMIRAAYGGTTPEIDAVLTTAIGEALLAHRDRIYERHLPLPLDF